MPWSKAWQSWGATDSTGMRPEEKEDLAIASQLWHPWKPYVMPRSYSSQPMALILHQRKNTPRTNPYPPASLPALGTSTGLSRIHSQEKWRWEHIRCCILVMLCLLVKEASYRRRNKVQTFWAPSGELCHSCWINQELVFSFCADWTVTEGFQQWSDQIHCLQEKDGLVKEASWEA